MTKLKIIIFLAILFAISDTFAQSGESDLRTFGYFQTTFQYEPGKNVLENGEEEKWEETSFYLQQLNLFLQKDLAQNWTALINFEILNNYSSWRNWGAHNLEEAWVRYRKNKYFNLKVGLQIPIFNNLNEIKNRTPLLPYVVRPLVYEASFNGLISIETYVPQRAFIQTYGFIPHHEAKIDYAFYIGNSSQTNEGSSNYTEPGLDNSDTFLFGGRLGVRFRELKTGLSLAHDKVDYFEDIVKWFFGNPPSLTSYRLKDISRIRVGGDLSYNWRNFSFESEFIKVFHHEDIPELDYDRQFYYLTLGYQITERLFVYGGYWLIKERTTVPDLEYDPELDKIITTEGAPVIVKMQSNIPGLGAAYNLSDRITLKVQFAPFRMKPENDEIPEEFYIFEDSDLFGFKNVKVKYSSAAISIFF